MVDAVPQPTHKANRRRKNKSKRKLLRLLQCSRCFYCLKKIKSSKTTVDHLIPICKGGGNELTNLVTCCKTCNSIKNATVLVDAFVSERIDVINHRDWDRAKPKCIKTICKLYSTA
jgi:5-methylcytosine-specific restriction endonuclease McrA